MSDSKKIQAIIGHLASEHEGEVIAAARALKRMADAKGKKLWEFLVVKEEQTTRTAANESVWAGGFNYYEQTRKAREAKQKYAEEQARKERERKQAEKEKAAREMYEKMNEGFQRYRQSFYDGTNSNEESPYDIYDKLRTEWMKEPSNWHELRDMLAKAVVKKGSDHLTTWEKEFLLDIFTWSNLSPAQRKKIEKIARERYGLNI